MYNQLGKDFSLGVLLSNFSLEKRNQINNFLRKIKMPENIETQP